MTSPHRVFSGIEALPSMTCSQFDELGITEGGSCHKLRMPGDAAICSCLNNLACVSTIVATITAYLETASNLSIILYSNNHVPHEHLHDPPAIRVRVCSWVDPVPKDRHNCRLLIKIHWSMAGLFQTQKCDGLSTAHRMAE